MIKTFIIYITLALSSYALFAQQAVNRVETFLPLSIQDTVYADSNTYSRLIIDSCDYYSVVGKPILPVKYVRILIPKGAKATGIVINGTSNPQNQTLSHKVCYGTLNMITGEQDSNSFDSVVYSQNTPFPSVSVSIVNEGYFRGNCIVTVAIYPVVYIPAAYSISYVSSIDFSLQYEIYPALKAEMEALPFDKDDRDFLGYMIDNKTDLLSFATLNQWTKSSGSMPIPVYCKYLIVTERKYINAFEELMDWKRRKGVPTQIVAIEDILANYTGDIISGIYDNAGKLRQFLSDAYKYGGIEYVLLAGDSIPIRIGTGSGSTNQDNYIPTDLYFSEFDGNWNKNGNMYYGEAWPYDLVDKYADISIGRIMPQSKWEVKNWVRKLLIYEQNPGNGDGTYLSKAFFTHSDEMQQSNMVNTKLIPSIYWLSYSKVFGEEGGANTSTIPNHPKGAEVINEFNNNYGIVSFLAHGMPNRVSVATLGLNNPDNLPATKYNVTSFDKDMNQFMVTNEVGNGFDNMTNYCHPSIFYSMSCTTMPFDNYNLDSGSRNMGDVYTCVSKGGGPAYLGNTRTGSVSTGPIYMGRFLRAVSENNLLNIGKIESYARTTTSEYERHFWYSHNLMGCPEMKIWTSQPNDFNVTLNENGNTINVNTNIIDPNGVTICVTSAIDNGASYFGIANNMASYSFNGIVKPYNVTITKHNYIPYIKNPENIFLQNIQWNNNRVISGDNFHIGSNVTTSINYGAVIFNSPANIILKPKYDVLILSDFEVASGASFEVKTKNNNYESECL